MAACRRPPLKHAVVESICDTQSLRILAATAGDALTVRDLARELDLPPTSLYRKVRLLQQAGALVARRVRDPRSGKHQTEYRSRVRALTLRFGADAPRVAVEYVDRGAGAGAGVA